MTEKPIRHLQANRITNAATTRRPLPRKLNRRPFWLPASNYYVLTAAGSIAVFFFVWGVLHDGGEDIPWVWAGIAASSVLGGAVAVREVVLRKARTRYLLTERQLDANIKNLPVKSPPASSGNAAGKLTVEQNAAIIKDLQQKSDAAKVLGKFSETHREVFELCDEYIALNRQQLETVGVGSPRLAALRRGREIVEPLREFHLLAWAQNESRSLTRESKIRVTISEKLEAAQKALTVLDSALSYYPDNPRLLESERAVREFAATIKVSHWIEQAERSAFKGHYKRAINHYRDALFFMARSEEAAVESGERRQIAERINSEIERLRVLSSKK